jgi:hypothetical protein
MKWSLALCSALFALQNAFAWGPVGHKIVAQIAENQLSYEAKSAISRLLPNQSLAEVSTWADEIKSQRVWDKSKAWHFVNLRDGETYESIQHEPEGDVITAINQMINILKSSSTSFNDRQIALKFLVHLVGDIHQPLHVGRPSDRGGNDIKVVFEGDSLNLHQLWDSAMIDKQQMDYLRYTQFLERLGLNTSSFYLAEFPFKDVVNESLSARNQIYNFGSSTSLYGANELNANYMRNNLTQMNNRLLLGGKRLAAILNQLFGRR